MVWKTLETGLICKWVNSQNVRHFPFSKPKIVLILVDRVNTPFMCHYYISVSKKNNFQTAVLSEKSETIFSPEHINTMDEKC